MTSGFTPRKTGSVLATISIALTLVVGASSGTQAATYVNAGSDTLQNVTRALTTEYTSSVDPNGNNWITVDAGKAAGSVGTGKAACNTNYGTGQNPWPNGSTAGYGALYKERTGATANCLSFTRSSRVMTWGDDASLIFTPVAKDAVTWAAKKPGVPNNLTQQQVKDIYNCTITNWNQIPGSTASGVIQKHIPQIGSGTRAEFIRAILGGVDPSTPVGGTCASTVIQTAQENRGDAPQITSVDAIIPYSNAAYHEQTSPITGVTNHTNGFVRGNIDGKAPNATNFVGNHPVYYVYDGVDTESDTVAIGFINWARAPEQQAIWNAFGFAT